MLQLRTLKQKGDEMNLSYAITLTQETLEETVFKLLKANIKEYEKNKEETVKKYMRVALNLRNKAYNYIDEHREEFIRFIGFYLQKGA